MDGSTVAGPPAPPRSSAALGTPLSAAPLRSRPSAESPLAAAPPRLPCASAPGLVVWSAESSRPAASPRLPGASSPTADKTGAGTSLAGSATDVGAVRERWSADFTSVAGGALVALPARGSSDPTRNTSTAVGFCRAGFDSGATARPSRPSNASATAAWTATETPTATGQRAVTSATAARSSPCAPWRSLTPEPVALSQRLSAQRLTPASTRSDPGASGGWRETAASSPARESAEPA